MHDVDLSIVIVNWNTRDLLAQCLRSILDSGASLAPEIIVVDNASSDASAAMVSGQFPSVRLIENRENLGFARANNQGLALAGGRYCLVLNSDTVVRPGALDILVSFMDAHPRAGGAAARLSNADGSLQLSCHPMLTPGREFWRLSFGDRLWPRATYRMAGWSIHDPRRVEVMTGACMLLRADALAQAGCFDESYFMYSEEVDLCYRLTRAGWELWWVPQADVLHYGGASSRQAAEAMYVQLYRSKVQFYRKFGGAEPADRFKLFLKLAYYPRWAVTRAACRFLPAMAVRARTYRRLLNELPHM